MEKTRAEDTGDPPNSFLNILNVGSISSRKHELETLYVSIKGDQTIGLFLSFLWKELKHLDFHFYF